MINQEQLPRYISHEIPELSAAIGGNKCRHVYDMVKQLFQYTARQLIRQDVDAARRSMKLAAELHSKGNSIVRMAIENVYVYSFSHAFFSNRAQRDQMLQLIPPPLYELYKKQVIYSHL